MYEIVQIIVAIGPRLYEVRTGGDCSACAFRGEVSDPCFTYCASLLSGKRVYFLELDAVRSKKFLSYLESMSNQEKES